MINDSLGHRIGDLLLCSVAARLKSLLREEDTVARLGGDEFVFIIPYVNRPDMPAHVAQKIIWALTEPHEIEGQDYSIGTSVGISLYPSDFPAPIVEKIENRFLDVLLSNDLTYTRPESPKSVHQLTPQVAIL